MTVCSEMLIFFTDDDGNSLTIRNVLEKIRFLTMTAEEFGKGRTSTSVLSDSDACAILSNIVYKDLTVPMPKGFSQTRDARKRVSYFCRPNIIM